jgi:hypothetical protein
VIDFDSAIERAEHELAAAVRAQAPAIAAHLAAVVELLEQARERWPDLRATVPRSTSEDPPCH